MARPSRYREASEVSGAALTRRSVPLDFAIRAHLVRQKNGGSGVYLLSVTPAKNSPLEYFSLLSLVDGDAWARLGIWTPRTSSPGISRLSESWFSTRIWKRYGARL